MKTLLFAKTKSSQILLNPFKAGLERGFLVLAMVFVSLAANAAPSDNSIVNLDQRLKQVSNFQEYLRNETLHTQHYRALETYFGYHNREGFARFYRQVLEDLEKLAQIDPALVNRLFKPVSAAPSYELQIRYPHKQLDMNTVALQIFARDYYPIVEEDRAIESAKKLKAELEKIPVQKRAQAVADSLVLQDLIHDLNCYAFRTFLATNPQIEKFFPLSDLSRERIVSRLEMSELVIAEYERFYQIEHEQILKSLKISDQVIKYARKNLVSTGSFISEHSIFEPASDVSRQVYPRPLNPKLKKGLYRFVPIEIPFNAIFMRFGSDPEEQSFLRWSMVALKNTTSYAVETHGTFVGYVQESAHIYRGKKPSIEKKEIVYLTEVKLPLLNGGQAIVRDGISSAKFMAEEWLSALPMGKRRILGGSDSESKFSGTSPYKTIILKQPYVNPSKERVLDPDKGQTALKRYFEKHQINDFDYGRNFEIEDQATVKRIHVASKQMGIEIGDLPENELVSTLYSKPKDRVWLLDEVNFDQHLMDAEQFRAAMRSKFVDQDVLMDRLMQVPSDRGDFLSLIEIAVFELQRESSYDLHRLLEWIRYYADYKYEVKVLKFLYDNNQRLIRNPLISKIVAELEFERNSRGDLIVPVHVMNEVVARLDKVRAVEYNFDLFVAPIERADEEEHYRERHWETFMRFFSDLPVDLQQFSINYLAAKYEHQESTVKLFKKYFVRDWYGLTGSKLKVPTPAKNPMIEVLKTRYSEPLLCHRVFQ